MNIGDKVICIHGDIDGKRLKYDEGTVGGFARFSSYHSREVWVSFKDGSGAWFWESSLEKKMEAEVAEV